jgi:sulfate permease, SulP family
MKIRSFEFNLWELAGSMGDFGTLFPLAIGYIAVCGLAVHYGMEKWWGKVV